jgi:hypothetical protein
VVRMPSFSRHDDRSTQRDVNGDGRVDERDDRYVAGMDERAAAERDGTPDPDRTAAERDRSAADPDRTAADPDRTAADPDRTAAEHDRTAADRAAGARVADDSRPSTAAVDTDGDGHADTVVKRDRDETPVAPAGPRPRASFMATLSLIFGVAGAAFVLSGVLAGYGIALGAIAVVLSFFGLSATRRRHVAGKTDALLGFGIGAAAIVIGILAMTGSFSWPTMEADWASRLREWLDSQFIDRF